MKSRRSPRETIRVYCLYCTGGYRREVESCDAIDSSYHQCDFHPYRTGKKRPLVKIMRQFCFHCMGGSSAMVRECETRDCLIHPFRFGKNPARAGKGYFAVKTASRNLQKQVLNEGFAAKFERSALRPRE